MKLLNRSFDDYDISKVFDGFRVEIEQGETETAVFIYHTEYMTKLFMFSLLNKDIKDDWHLRDIIAANIETYKTIYEKNFMR